MASNVHKKRSTENLCWGWDICQRQNATQNWEHVPICPPGLAQHIQRVAEAEMVRRQILHKQSGTQRTATAPMSIGEPVTEWIAAPFNIPSPQPKATLTAPRVSDDFV